MKNMLIPLYRNLCGTFGLQHWWPVTFSKEKGPEYNPRKELTEKQQFEIMVGAILTQNTSWKNVEKAIMNLIGNDALSVEKIKSIKKEKLAALIKSSGYFNQKAVKLKALADFLSKNPIRSLTKEKDLRLVRNKFLEIKGIGPETADSILLYALGKPVFVIDAYTKRIMGRIGYKESSYDEWQQLFMKELPSNAALFSEYHALLVELAKQNCRKTPICETCPLLDRCHYGKSRQNNNS